MSAVEIGFWCCVFLILYPYLIYPFILLVLSRLVPRPVRRDHARRSVSFVISARNEQDTIAHRLEEFIALLERTGLDGEIIVVSDGSTDDTAAVVRLYQKQYVRLLELLEWVGKAEALNRGVALARHEIVVFADVRQVWADDALLRLLENFADPHIGAVSGDLVLTSRDGTMSGMGAYWHYEKWIRRTESRIGSQIGVTGAISACRRTLYQPVPPGTLLDDVCWPLLVAMQGYRVYHDTRAVAHDRLPERPSDEFRRKVRTLAGNFQLVARLPQALLPWKNPVWGQLISHKLSRLVVPWALIGLFLCGIQCRGWIYDLALFAQAVVYSLSVLGLWTKRGGLMAAAASFVVLNAAAWVAFWVWLTGKAENSWGKVSYATLEASARRLPALSSEEGLLTDESDGSGESSLRTTARPAESTSATY